MSEPTTPVEPAGMCTACQSRPIYARGMCSTCYSAKRREAVQDGTWTPRLARKAKRPKAKRARWCVLGCRRKATAHGVCATCYSRAHRRAVASGVWTGKWTAEVAALLAPAVPEPQPTRPVEAATPCEACGAAGPAMVIHEGLCGWCRSRRRSDTHATPEQLASSAHAALTSPARSVRGASPAAGAFDHERLAMLEACLGVLGPAIAATPPMLRSLLNDELPALIAAYRAMLERGDT